MNFYLFMCLWTSGTLAIVTILAICADRKSQDEFDRTFNRTEANR